VEGSSIDRNVFVLLLLAGLWVLRRRKVNWHTLIANNRWLFGFYLFFGLSMIWSDYSFVSLKRWIKDLGNVVMVLIILTETDRMEAVRAVFARCASFFIPISVLYIKYLPDLGRAYDRWSGRAFYQGATIGKNMLGGATAILMVFLVRDLLALGGKAAKPRRKVNLFCCVLLLIMGSWLLLMADSATSLACTLLGSFGLIALNLPFVRTRIKNLLGYAAGAAAIVLLASTFIDVGGSALSVLGRDSSLTGRTDIWKAVLAEKSNPIIGVGFYSFWLGSRVDKLWDKYSFRLNQAHNGYLEIYLNGGVIAVFLLLGALTSSGRRINRRLMYDPNWEGLKLMIWLIVVIYNWSEASFCRLSLTWFALLTVVIEYPRRTAALQPAKASTSFGDLSQSRQAPNTPEEPSSEAVPSPANAATG
jgi:exopolysaccharide production protein ExoQ